MSYDIKHVIFDLDGTISDSKEGITTCMQSALKSIGASNIPDANEMSWCIGPPIESSFATILKDNTSSLIDRAVEAYRHYYYEGKGELLDKPFSGVKEMLVSLYERGYKLYIATLKPQASAQKILERYQFDGYFSGIFGFEQNGTSHIKDKLIAHIINEYNLSKHQVAMVGDREFDIIGANQNEVMSVAVSYGYGTSTELNNAGPDVICHMPEAISDVFANK